MGFSAEARYVNPAVQSKEDKITPNSLGRAREKSFHVGIGVSLDKSLIPEHSQSLYIPNLSSRICSNRKKITLKAFGKI